MKIRKIDTTNFETPESATTYGSPQDRVVVKEDGDERRYSLNEVTMQSWQFEVPDDKLGVRTVAAALGNGMSNASPSDDCSELYEKWGKYCYKGGYYDFHTPVILLAYETIGYRAAWGDIVKKSRRFWDYTCEEEDWAIDVYKLQPGLPDGGFLVQSCWSSATIVAQKAGNTWTLTLTMPILPSGRKVGMTYESAFRGAYNQYRRALAKN